MSLFEFTFGLSAVILGLALAQLASSYHRLAMAGRRVKWSIEPILLSAIIFLVIVSVWLFQWQLRHDEQTTIGLMLLQVLKLILPFLAAAFVLPDVLPDSGEIDLRAHYDRTRAYTFGALIAGLLLFWTHRLLEHAILSSLPTLSIGEAIARFPWTYLVPYLLRIFIRARWFNILMLVAVLIFYSATIIPITLRV